MKLTHVFELVEASDEENYFTHGIFLNEKDALAVLRVPAPPTNDNEADPVTFEVRLRRIGFHPHEYTTVAARTWTREFPEGTEENEWSFKDSAKP